MPARESLALPRPYATQSLTRRALLSLRSLSRKTIINDNKQRLFVGVTRRGARARARCLLSVLNSGVSNDGITFHKLIFDKEQSGKRIQLRVVLFTGSTPLLSSFNIYFNFSFRLCGRELNLATNFLSRLQVWAYSRAFKPLARSVSLRAGALLEKKFAQVTLGR